MLALIGGYGGDVYHLTGYHLVFVIYFHRDISKEEAESKHEICAIHRIRPFLIVIGMEICSGAY